MALVKKPPEIQNSIKLKSIKQYKIMAWNSPHNNRFLAAARDCVSHFALAEERVLCNLGGAKVR